MHLRAIRIRGFKSFPEPVEVRLEPGVAVVVGPNGSGKSNVADALLWASGSLSPHELRAEKPDDVLFAGAADRPAADYCQVELLADVGLGGSHGSVISQGKVEEILASKPEERRVLIEDAAGLGKFKRR